MADYPSSAWAISVVTTTRDSRSNLYSLLGPPRVYSMRAVRTSTGATIAWPSFDAPDATGALSGVPTSDITPGSIRIAGQR